LAIFARSVVRLLLLMKKGAESVTPAASASAEDVPVIEVKRWQNV